MPSQRINTGIGDINPEIQLVGDWEKVSHLLSTGLPLAVKLGTEQGQVSAANAANNAAVAENYSANAGVVASQMPSSDGMSDKVGVVFSAFALRFSISSSRSSTFLFAWI